MAEADPTAGGLVIAYDVLGGSFAWMPAEPGSTPTVHYLDPSDLTRHDLGLGYKDWLGAVLGGILASFYEDLRWPGWEAEVAAVPPDQGIHAWPPPWSEEGRDLSAVSRKAVPMSELLALHGSATQI
jgi:hypothetical protein